MLTSNKVSHKGYKANWNIFMSASSVYLVMYLLLKLCFHRIPLNVPLFVHLQYLRKVKCKRLHVRIKRTGNCDSSNVSMKKQGTSSKFLHLSSVSQEA